MLEYPVIRTRRMRRHPTLTRIAPTLLVSLCVPATALADSSSWSTRVGAVDAEERTVWCTPISLPPSGERAGLAISRLQRIASDSSIEDGFVSPVLTQQLRVTCRGNGGISEVVTSSASTDEAGDLLTVQCPPDAPEASFPTCMLSATEAQWWVYRGTDCGNGVAPQPDRPAVHDVKILGQMTGGFYEVTVRPPFVDPPSRPLFNDTCGNGVRRPGDSLRVCNGEVGMGGYVGGTDLGFSFLGGGRLHVGFGDTWPSEGTVPLTGPVPVPKRGSVLFRSDDKDPSDGLKFADFERTPASSRVAMEVIPSPHDEREEISAINLAGFSVRENGHTYRFLWFATIGNWFPDADGATVGHSTLAWSVDGSVPFVRGDRQTTYRPPQWSGAGSFGAGNVWHDHESGYVYFFGIAPYLEKKPVQLARVEARVDAILDTSRYRYWNGNAESWDPDMQNATDIIPGSANARPEISVVYSSYANRWLMLLTPWKTADAQLQLWQSPPLKPGQPWTPAGRWERVATAVNGSEPLPNTQSAPGLYGPYTSDHLSLGGGRDIYFLLSHWGSNTLSLFPPAIVPVPYNVSLWKFSISRHLRDGCLLP